MRTSLGEMDNGSDGDEDEFALRDEQRIFSTLTLWTLSCLPLDVHVERRQRGLANCNGHRKFEVYF